MRCSAAAKCILYKGQVRLPCLWLRPCISLHHQAGSEFCQYSPVHSAPALALHWATSAARIATGHCSIIDLQQSKACEHGLCPACLMRAALYPACWNHLSDPGSRDRSGLSSAGLPAGRGGGAAFSFCFLPLLELCEPVERCCAAPRTTVWFLWFCV